MARRREGRSRVSAPESAPLRKPDAAQEATPSPTTQSAQEGDPISHSVHVPTQSAQRQDPVAQPVVGTTQPDLDLVGLERAQTAESKTPLRAGKEGEADNKENMDPSTGSSPVTCASGGVYASSSGKGGGVPLSLAATPVSAAPSHSTPLSGMPSLAATPTPMSEIRMQGNTPHSASSAGSLCLDLQILPPYAQRAAGAYQATPGGALPPLQPSPCGQPAPYPSPCHDEPGLASANIHAAGAAAVGHSSLVASSGGVLEQGHGHHPAGAAQSQSQAMGSPVLGGAPAPGHSLPPSPCGRAMVPVGHAAPGGSLSPLLSRGIGPLRTTPAAVSPPGGLLFCPITTPMSVAVNESVEVRWVDGPHPRTTVRSEDGYADGELWTVNRTSQLWPWCALLALSCPWLSLILWLSGGLTCSMGGRECHCSPGTCMQGVQVGDAEVLAQH